MRFAATLALGLALLAGPAHAQLTEPPLLLIVDVITDYLPGVEFTATRATATGPSSPLPASDPAFSTEDFIAGQRVGEFDVLPGAYTVTVDLLRPDGMVLDSRIAIVLVTVATGYTAVIARTGDPAPSCDELIAEADAALEKCEDALAAALKQLLTLQSQVARLEEESAAKDRRIRRLKRRIRRLREALDD